MTIGTVEALKPHWTWKRKLVAASIGGAVAVLFALYLIYRGWWGHTADAPAADNTPAAAQPAKMMQAGANLTYSALCLRVSSGG